MILSLLAALAAAPSVAAPDYARDEAWLCRPDLADPCDEVGDATVVAADGTLTVEAAPAPAADPAADCFYVYPTVSTDRGANSDASLDEAEARVAFAQAARFSTVCRVFAPLYRQQSLAGLRARMTGRKGGDTEVAYGDVARAWRAYLAEHNEGRPFVLIGHSQGTGMLRRLLAGEVEGSPAADRMLSAMLLGLNIEVPRDGVHDGARDGTPLCERAAQTGCIVAHVTFLADSPPPQNALFGRAGTHGMTVACTDVPAMLGRPGVLDAYLLTEGSGSSGRKPKPWAKGAKIETPWVKVPGLLTGGCVQDGPLGYLAVTVNADPDDPRTDDIGGEVQVFRRQLRGWGLHLGDVNIVQGDLIELVARQSAAFGAGGPSEDALDD